MRGQPRGGPRGAAGGGVVGVAGITARHSIEEKILRMQETKRDLADQILEGAQGAIGSMSREELLALVDGN